MGSLRALLTMMRPNHTLASPIIFAGRADSIAARSLSGVRREKRGSREAGEKGFLKRSESLPARFGLVIYG